MIVAGEASGDLHGANLVRALRESLPDAHFTGMGGSELKRAGVDVLFDASRIAVVGAVEIISRLGDILAARRTLINRMREHRPDLLILIDYPEFNLLLAKKAKAMGIAVFYYISPQIWAWRKKRVHKIARLANRVAVILPFEQAFYARYGYEVDFVGHPLLDTVRPTQNAEALRASLGIAPEKTLIAILPGSRTREITSLLPDFLAAANLLSQQHPSLTFLMPQAPTIDRSLLETHGLAEARKTLDIHVVTEDRYSVMAACTAAMAASGTVLMELAILDVPTVATYRVSPITYYLGRLLIHGVHFFSLVNLIGGRAIIPELLQKEVTPEHVAKAMEPLISPTPERAAMLAGFAEVRQKLGGPGASRRAAQMALQFLDRD